jgi:hypothetical protein
MEEMLFLLLAALYKGNAPMSGNRYVLITATSVLRISAAGKSGRSTVTKRIHTDSLDPR